MDRCPKCLCGAYRTLLSGARVCLRCGHKCDGSGPEGKAALPPVWANMPEPLPPPDAPFVWPVYLQRTRRRLGVYRGEVPTDGTLAVYFARRIKPPSFSDYLSPPDLPTPPREAIVTAYIDRDHGLLWVMNASDLLGARGYQPE